MSVAYEQCKKCSWVRLGASSLLFEGMARTKYASLFYSILMSTERFPPVYLAGTIWNASLCIGCSSDSSDGDTSDQGFIRFCQTAG